MFHLKKKKTMNNSYCLNRTNKVQSLPQSSAGSDKVGPKLTNHLYKKSEICYSRNSPKFSSLAVESIPHSAPAFSEVSRPREARCEPIIGRLFHISCISLNSDQIAYQHPNMPKCPPLPALLPPLSDSGIHFQL